MNMARKLGSGSICLQIRVVITERILTKKEAAILKVDRSCWIGHPPFFFFRLASNAFLAIRSVGRT